ncbi:hypothetical protein ALC56_14376 [Trachymyrmex septentrionalis]|uniref:Uncharacterized protein n=1 Tax=Trachymyrmex septentrionalis TaxID=34720 RepID=A0A195ETB8_9HYME|nr:hypothetical protein ALC56_14376 [Trachymyrmex septentrionalis]
MVREQNHSQDPVVQAEPGETTRCVSFPLPFLFLPLSLGSAFARCRGAAYGNVKRIRTEGRWNICYALVECSFAVFTEGSDREREGERERERETEKESKDRAAIVQPFSKTKPDSHLDLSFTPIRSVNIGQRLHTARRAHMERTRWACRCVLVCTTEFAFTHRQTQVELISPNIILLLEHTARARARARSRNDERKRQPRDPTTTTYTDSLTPNSEYSGYSELRGDANPSEETRERERERESYGVNVVVDKVKTIVASRGRDREKTSRTSGDVEGEATKRRLPLSRTFPSLFGHGYRPLGPPPSPHPSGPYQQPSLRLV